MDFLLMESIDCGGAGRYIAAQTLDREEKGLT